ncbi:MAG: 4Fe-4S binding protein, partial [Desulfuromonadales bacterium]|nr:4Fe-4S binding protein [Desulfuromonadales bacterium]
ARLWQEYYCSGWGEGMFGGAPFTRVIPVAKSVEPGQEILPYEKAAELISEYDFAVVIHCPCRKSAELAGGGCGKPTEVCFHFGDLARFMVDKGLGREVSRQEVLEILDMTEKAGLVHMVGNSKEMGVALCSCCSCCCTQLRAIAEFSIPNTFAMASSRFQAELAGAKCISCGVCAERCGFGAIAIGDDGRIDGGKCLGCGLCVTTCPTEAITLKERGGYQEPPATGLELFEAWSKKPA